MKKGFTLAEVLITLTIIGVIAALTIPNLITNYQKQQTIVGLKKAYSILSQAYTQSTKENGPIPEFRNTSEINPTVAINLFNEYWKPYIKTESKLCYRLSCDTECRKNQNYNIYDLYHNLQGNGWCGSMYLTGDNFNLSTTLSDGSILAIDFFYKNIFIDINGKKNPNTIGKDIFVFTYNQNISNIVPAGYQASYNDINNRCINQIRSNSYYYQCTSKIIQDGWQIKDDYPW